MSRYFPFQALGLRCNPFRALTDDEWSAVAVLPEAVSVAVAAGPGHLQILGPAGHGKTTALLGLASRLRGAAYEYLPEGRRRFRTRLAGLEVFLLDEAQRLAFGEPRRLLAVAARARVRLIVSSHLDLRPLFDRARQPLTTLKLDSRGDAGHLGRIVERRLAYFALPGGPCVRLAPATIEHLHAACAGDLRRAERWMYEVFQQLLGLGAPGEVTPTHLQAAAEPFQPAVPG